MDYKKARERNLLIKICNWVISKQENDLEQFLNKPISDNILKKEIFFKQSDIKEYSEDFIENNELKEEKKNIIKKYIKNHIEYKDNNEMENYFKELYLWMDKYWDNSYIYDENEYNEKLEEAKSIAKKLHWKYMPVYLEQYIENAGIIPEENLDDYYNHFHAIEDLYRYICNNKIDWKSTGGDENLNKELALKIYTTRWGHFDNYTIKRTIEGWEMNGLPAGTGHCEKDGKGALGSALKQDGVAYPEAGLHYAMEILWEEADNTPMTIEVLQERLNDISKWIEMVEKATKEYQPSWCGYY